MTEREPAPAGGAGAAAADATVNASVETLVPFDALESELRLETDARGPELVTRLQQDQVTRWRLGQRVPAEEYLRLHERFQPLGEDAVDLVYGEFALRQYQSESPPCAEFLQRFPQYEAALRRQFALDEAITDLDAPGTVPPHGQVSESTDRPHLPGYEIINRIGHGAMGVVYKARQVALNRFVAIKLVAGEACASDAHRERLRREAEAVARLQHANIVQIHEVGEANGRLYLALEYVNGGNLAQQLAGNPQQPAEAARLVRTLAEAIHYAHEHGVVHRDLKPANVLLSFVTSHSSLAEAPRPMTKDKGQVAIPKIADFGLAKLLEVESTQTQSEAVVGTPSYMAPEQAGGARARVGPTADVHALGAILYEMLTGRPPYKAATVIDTLFQLRDVEPVPPRRLQPRTPADLETICLKCLEKRPEKRYPSAVDLAEDLGRYLDGEPIEARPARLWERGWKWVRRRPAAAALLTVSAAALAAVLGLSLFYNAELKSSNRDLRDAVSTAETRRLEAEGERQRANTNASAALAQASEARKQKADADTHFSWAREAVDDYMTKISEDPRLTERGMEELRKELLKSALEYYQRFSKVRGDDPEIRFERACALGRLASISSSIGSVPEALNYQLECVSVLDALSQQFPAEVRFRSMAGRAYHNLALWHRFLQQREPAEAAFRKALKERQRLFDESPEATLSFKELGASTLAFGQFCHERGQHDQAESLIRTAVELQAVVCNRPVATTGDRVFHGTMFMNLGVVLIAQGRLKDAEGAFLKARELSSRAVAEKPNSTQYRMWHASNLLGLANLYQAGGRFKDMEPVVLEVIALDRGLTQEHPLVLEHRDHLALAYFYLGGCYRELEQWDRSAAALESSGAEYARLVEANPKFAQYMRGQARAYLEIAKILYIQRDFQKSLANTEAARRVAAPLAAPDIKERFARPMLLECNLHLARTLVALDRPQDALVAWDRCPQFAETTDQEQIRVGRALTLASLGKHQAVADFDRHADEPGMTPADLVYVAKVYARALSAVRADATLAAGERDRLAGKYLQRAEQLLKRAEKAGAFREATFRAELRHTAFESLKSNAIYQEIVKESAEKPKQP